MRGAFRFAIETVLLMVLAGGMLVVAILGTRLIDDEKVRYFVLGYYMAIHNDLVRWIWKKLRVEKAAE